MPLPTSKELEEALYEIHEISSGGEDEVADGFGRLDEWMTALKLAERATREKLLRGVKAGIFERKTYRVRWSDGRLAPAPHWRLIPKEERNLLSPKA